MHIEMNEVSTLLTSKLTQVNQILVYICNTQHNSYKHFNSTRQINNMSICSYQKQLMQKQTILAS